MHISDNIPDLGDRRCRQHVSALQRRVPEVRERSSEFTGEREDINEIQNRLKSLAEELVETEERERRRLAAQLHDGIGQVLSLMSMKLRRLELDDTARAEAVEEIRLMLIQVIRDTRSLTYDLFPPYIHDVSLPAALSSVKDRIEAQYNVNIETDLLSPEIRVHRTLHVLLFMGVRELLLNCIKHAQASRIELAMGRDEDILTISVRDDGVGFPEEVLRGQGKTGGVGLYHMRERFADFNVHLEVVSAAGEGSTVTIRVPAVLVEIH